jgi:hypothetical protein
MLKRSRGRRWDIRGRRWDIGTEERLTTRAKELRLKSPLGQGKKKKRKFLVQGVVLEANKDRPNKAMRFQCGQRWPRSDSDMVFVQRQRHEIITG